MDCPDQLCDFFWSGASEGGFERCQGVTPTFFELQTPDFVWKFIWTVQRSDKVQKYKIQKYKNTKTKKAKNAKKMLI